MHARFRRQVRCRVGNRQWRKSFAPTPNHEQILCSAVRNSLASGQFILMPDI
jgi:hypothetical protein